MKSNLYRALASVLLVSSLLLPSKKAEAGIVLISSGTAVVPAVLGILVSPALVSIGIWGLGQCSNRIYEPVSCFGGSALATLVGAGLFVLDDEGQPQQYKTIPSYLLAEVEARSLAKGEFLEADENGMRHVVFTDTEVDDLFDLADEFSSTEELDHLRSVLTSPLALQVQFGPDIKFLGISIGSLSCGIGGG